MDKDHLRGACPAGSGLFEYLKQVPSLRKIMALREREFRTDPVRRGLCLTIKDCFWQAFHGIFRKSLFLKTASLPIG